MALELAEHGILVNSVAPGEISTPMTRPGGGSSKRSSGPLHRGPATGQHDVDPHAEERPRIPLGRPGHAREIAGAIVHLAGPDATYTTGASWVIDGGLLLMAAVR